jgi:bifunctional DNase/RNase
VSAKKPGGGKSGSGKDLLVEVRGIVPTPSGSGIFLSHGKKIITIFVDPSVSAAITMVLQGVQKPRPLTHDLIGSIFTGLGVKMQKVVINDLKEDTFFARIFLVEDNELGTKIVEIDARPSDSIALALHHKCPIFVVEKVWNQAEDMSWALEQAEKASEDAQEDGDANDSAEPPTKKE